jgi:hypothetical protein
MKPGPSSAVLKQLFEFVRQALFLQRDVQQLKQDVAGLERGLNETNEALRQLAFEVQRINERELHEREKFVLRVENALLRMERQLPPAGGSKKRK